MITEVKTSIEGLEIGMFVSRLDRPWLKTPFTLQGVQIKTRDDIEKLRKYCNYVYVDVEKGSTPDPRFWVLKEGTGNHQQPANARRHNRIPVNVHSRDEFSKVRKQQYSTSTQFTSELETAKDIVKEINTDLKQMLTKLERGGELDIAAVRKGISDMTESIIRNPSAMMWIISLRSLDDYSYSRALSTSVWCATFGRHLGLEKSSIENLALGGLLLDIGKTGLPQELLHKKGPLNPEEFGQIQTHVDLGVKILANSKQPGSGGIIPMEALQMVATHHERADGSGYPQSLANNEIPLFGRIAGIVDSYDAMNSRRPHLDADAKPPHEAIAELYALRGGKFQAELIEHFIQAVGLYPTGSLVELSTGEVGAVVAINGLRRLRPSVILLLDKDKEPLPQFVMMDLSQASEDITVAHGLPVGAYGVDMNELFL
ncbi:MAG: HD-GYP domain-containing protein [Gammaproteobacteria bacterium]